jgi:hypothetical protein
MRLKPWMKRVTGFVGLAMLAVAAQADAQTTAAGPYYATPSWDQTMPTTSRFVVLSNLAGGAVLDRETGLVWQQSPPDGRNGIPFEQATESCWQTSIGQRYGWRLPSPSELASLADRTLPSDAVFPNSGPFTFVTPLRGRYWTNAQQAPGVHWTFAFGGDFGYHGLPVDDTQSAATVWCVRGPSGVGG